MRLKIIYLILLGLNFSGLNYASAISSSSFGDQKTAVILVNFPDNLSQPKTVAEINTLVFTDVNNFLRENSFQKSGVVGNATYGWFTVPVSTTYCDVDAIAAEGNKQAIAAGANLSLYTQIIYMWPSNTGCGWSGTGGKSATGQKLVYINDIAGMSVKTIAHEIGHGFGLMHSNGWDCDVSAIGNICTLIGYGDPADTMGTRLGHFNAFQKEYLGWLNYGSAPPITTASSSGTYRIGIYEAQDMNAKALKVLKSIDQSTGKKTYYYLEYRQPVGFDIELGKYGNLTKGILVHLGTEGDVLASSKLLDMTPNTSELTRVADFEDGALNVGATYTDSTAGVSITLVSADTTGASINVQFGSVSPPPPPPPPTSIDTIAPTVSITSPVSGSKVKANSTILISANASDNIGISRVEFYANSILKCSDAAAPYSCSYTIPKGNNKIYNIEARAFDAAGNSSSSQVSVTSGR